MGTLVFQATLGGAVNIIGPNIANTINFTLPSADGTSGQTWTTNGSGVLAFGTLGIAGGGTGQITATAAFNALAPSQSGQSGKYLTTDGTNTSWGTNPLGTVTSVAATVPSFLSIAGSPITTSGTLAFTLSGTALPTTSGGTGLTSFTSGGVVYASSTSALATGSALSFDGQTFDILTPNATPLAISSSNASATLVLHKNANAVADLFYRFRQNNGGGNFYDLTMEGSTNAFTIDYNDNERLRITSAGNVGIGTSSPATLLEVYRNGANNTAGLRISNANASGYSAALEFWTGYNGGKVNSLIYGQPNGLNGGDLIFQTRNQATDALVDRVTIDNAGNVGIGTSSPQFGVDLRRGSGADAYFLAAGNNNGTTAGLLVGQDTTGLSLIWQYGANPITFWTNSTERARIPSTGGIQSVNSISVGNATPTTSGAGITFPATQSASSDANTLDDYEEGTWSPTMNALTGTFTTTSVTSATYTKIGRMVAIQAKCSPTSIGTGADGFQLTNLPFTSSPTNAFAIAGKNISNDATFNGYIESSGTTMRFAVTMINTHTYMINGTYFV